MRVLGEYAKAMSPRVESEAALATKKEGKAMRAAFMADENAARAR